MTQIIHQVTQNLINRLPKGNQYYRLDELYGWEFPSFIIKRIKIELERNLAESMIPPKTDWANIQSNRVEDSWDEFVKAIRAEAHLPASYAKTVIETAVADVLEMLVQPRKNVPEIIFGIDKELTYKQVCDRVQLIVVYYYFATLLPRYMEKKELEQLSKTQCEVIIKNADQKLTRRYSPLNWAQMLEPLFKLMDGKVDTNLLRLFFKDKNMSRLARQFDLMDENIGRAHFIEVLSSPEALNFEGYKDDQSTLFTDEPVDENSEKEESLEKEEQKVGEEQTEQSEREEKADGKSDTYEESIEKEQEIEIEEENNLNAFFAEDIDLEKEDEIESEPDSSLNAVFPEDESEQEKKDEQFNMDASFTKESSKEMKYEDPQLVNEEDSDSADLENNEIEESLEEPDEVKEGSNSKSEDHSPQIIEQPPEGEESPMWMSYMSEEEIAEYNKQKLDESEEGNAIGNDEEEFIDESANKLTEQQAPEIEIEQLKIYLADDRDFFVKEIFNRSDQAFDKTVEKLSTFKSWQSASNYINKNVFKRNLIDMYSEAAVDFTDHLQTYFSSNLDS